MVGEQNIDETSPDVVAFLQRLVKSLTPAVVDAVQRKSTGHFEVHFASGLYRSAKRTDNL